MLIKRKRGWEIAQSLATPEALFRDRRRLCQAIAAGPLLAPTVAAALAAGLRPVHAQEADPSGKLYPFKQNTRYSLDRPITDEKLATTYDNFYEFGSQKNIVREAQALKVRPWTIRIDGMVEQPMEIGIDDLMAKMPLEERLYRHRCVEAWSMAVPWSGFALKPLVELAKPLSSAKYLRMETFKDPKIAPGQKQTWYPWPYVEGVTVQEAVNELSFMVTGAYGKPLPAQNGAPLRLALPWKFGFKHIKSIVRITFTDKQPKSFWEEIQGSEYGFWANVNPKVPHPRWSQATEQPLGSKERVPTLLYNGYGEFVADLYKGMDEKKLFM